MVCVCRVVLWVCVGVVRLVWNIVALLVSLPQDKRDKVDRIKLEISRIRVKEWEDGLTAGERRVLWRFVVVCD